MLSKQKKSLNIELGQRIQDKGDRARRYQMVRFGTAYLSPGFCAFGQLINMEISKFGGVQSSLVKLRHIGQ